MRSRVLAALLTPLAVLTSAAFLVPGKAVPKGAVLRESVPEIMASFPTPETAAVLWSAILVPSATLFARFAIGVGRLARDGLSRDAAIRVIDGVRIAAAVVPSLSSVSIAVAGTGFSPPMRPAADHRWRIRRLPEVE